ncbi:MAG TPA: helix-turn-helix domain-containing protein [Actinomycetota bacterium]
MTATKDPATGPEAPDAEARRLAATGVRPSPFYAVVIATPFLWQGEDVPARASRAAGLLRSHLAPPRRHLISSERDRAVAVCGLDHPHDYPRLVGEVDRTLVSLEGIAAAAGSPQPGVEGIPVSHREATEALDIRLRIEHPWPTLRYDQAAPYMMIQRTPSVAATVIAPIRPVLEIASAAERRDLLEAIETYLAATGRVVPAAMRLNVSPKTLYRRLARVAALTNLDLNDAEARFKFELSLRALRLRQGTGTEALRPRGGTGR